MSGSRGDCWADWPLADMHPGATCSWAEPLLTDCFLAQHSGFLETKEGNGEITEASWSCRHSPEKLWPSSKEKREQSPSSYCMCEV